MNNKVPKDVRLNYQTWALVRAKSVELSLKTGTTITIKAYIEEAIMEKLNREKG